MLGIRSEFRDDQVFAGHVLGERRVDEGAPDIRQPDDASACVVGIGLACDQSAPGKAVHAFGEAAAGDHGVVGELARPPLVGSARAPEGREDVELGVAEIEAGIDLVESILEQATDAVQASDDALRGGVDVGALATPLCLDLRDAVGCGIHALTVSE